MSKMTDKMSESGSGYPKTESQAGHPRKGERYHCDKCGMEVQVTTDCQCQEPDSAHFRCCGQELQKA